MSTLFSRTLENKNAFYSTFRPKRIVGVEINDAARCLTECCTVLTGARHLCFLNIAVARRSSGGKLSGKSSLIRPVKGEKSKKRNPKRDKKGDSAHKIVFLSKKSVYREIDSKNVLLLLHDEKQLKQ